MTTLTYICVIAANDDRKQGQRTIVLEKNLSVGQDKSSHGPLEFSGLGKGIKSNTTYNGGQF